jgi:hypothetical protein
MPNLSRMPTETITNLALVNPKSQVYNYTFAHLAKASFALVWLLTGIYICPFAYLVEITLDPARWDVNLRCTSLDPHRFVVCKPKSTPISLY